MKNTVLCAAPVILENILSELDGLIEAAALAPSGDNTQPWRIVADPAQYAIDIFLDSARENSPLNSGQHMSLIACGAAIENMHALAAARGWKTCLKLFELSDFSSVTRVARIELIQRADIGNASHIANAIRQRVTNRHVYDGRPVSSANLAELQCAAAPAEGVGVHWIVDAKTIAALSALIGRADAIMFGEPSIRRAFLKNVRFDLPVDAHASEGLPLAALEVSAPVRLGLRMLPLIPDALFTVSGTAKMLGAKSRKLVLSASGLCLVAVGQDCKHRAVRSGQSIQRGWLALTQKGLSAQPMMSLMVLNTALCFGAPALRAALQRQGAVALLYEFNAILKAAGIEGDPQFILRFGHASEPSGRTGRRPYQRIQQVLS